MQSLNKGITLRLAIVATAAMVLVLAGTPAVSSASDTAGGHVAQTTVGAAATLDTLPQAATTASTLAGLQPMDDDHGGWWDNGWWVVMPLMMVIFWGGVLGIVVWGIRQFTQGKGRDRSPLDIARERLAKGEISKDEFDGIRSDLA